MTPQVEQILEQALRLSDGEQLELVDALNASVDERGLRPFDDAWLAEIQRRSREYDQGGIRPIPWSEVKARARAGDADRA